MASNFLKRKAEERAKKIDKEYGVGTYGSTADLNKKREVFEKNSDKSSSTKSGGATNEKSRGKASSFLRQKVVERSLVDEKQPYKSLDKTVSNIAEVANLGASVVTKKPSDTPKSYIDFNNETKDSFSTFKNKMSSTTTIPSNLTEEERKKRVGEIKSELSQLSTARNYINRGAMYGDVSSLIEKNEARQTELSKELRELERVGTFTGSEMLQFEIDDAKTERALIQSKNINPNRSRPSVDEAEEWRETQSKRFNLEAEIKELKRKQNLYDDITKFGDVVNEDDFFGQWKANYRSTELHEDAAKAFSTYMDNPTDENREIALVYDAFVKEYMKNNEKALDDEGQVLALLSDNFASYLAQQKGSAGTAIPLGIVGGIVGSLGGGAGIKAGWTAGYSIGSGINSYNVIRGSLFSELISYGMDEETARKLAEDDAIIESLIESGETAKDWAFMLFGGGIGKGANIASKAVDKAAKSAAKPFLNLGKNIVTGVGLNAGTEYLEEGAQGAVSRATREKAWAIIDSEIGQYGEGNIDLYNRPTYKNADGTISTVDSVTFIMDGKYVVLPTIVRDENGKAKRLNTDEEIFAHYEKTGEYLGRFDTLEESNIYANRLHYAQAYRYSESTSVDDDDNLLIGSGKVIADAIFGGNTEALGELHEQGVEGFKTGLITGGIHGTVRFVVSSYATAKTVKERNEIADAVLADDESLNALIEEGKASGEGTVSAKIAEEVEQAKANGNVTRKQVKKLIVSNEKYINAEEKTTAPATLEDAAREVVEKKNKQSAIEMLESRKRGKVDAELLENLTRDNVEITTEEVKKVTGFGDRGAELVANYSNEDGVTFNQVIREVKSSYMTGLKQPDLDIKKLQDTFISKAQEDAYTAGQIDRKMKELADKANARNVVVNKESGFDTTDLPKDVTKTHKEIVDLLAKGLGVRAYISKGLKGNAELRRATGEVPIDFEFEREIGAEGNKQKVSIVFHAAHEIALHRVVELAPEEGNAFVYAMYNHLAGDESLFSSTLADEKRAAYGRQNVEITLAEAMEEISANNILYLYGNDEVKFQKAMERIINGNDVKAKQGLAKYIECLKDIIKRLRNYIVGKTGKARAEGQAALDEVIKLRDMFETAVAKAVENRKAAEANQSTDTKSAKNLEIKTNEEYNGNISHSLKGKQSAYNEYNTIGMQWAYHPDTKVGDQKVLYNSYTDEFVLVVATKKGVGFADTWVSTYEQKREDERIYESNEKGEYIDDERAIDTAIHNYEVGQNNNSRNNVNGGNRGRGIQNAEVSKGKSDSDRTANSKSTEEKLNKNGNVFIDIAGNRRSLFKDNDLGYSVIGTRNNSYYSSKQEAIEAENNFIKSYYAKKLSVSRSYIDKMLKEDDQFIINLQKKSYSLKDSLQTKIKYSPKGIKLSANEYAKFNQSTSTDYYMSYKTHEGLQYQSCVFDDKHILYIYEDGGFGSYNVVARIDYADEEVVKLILKEIQNGETYRIANLVNRIVKILKDRRGSYTLYNAYTKERRRSGSYGIVSKGQSKSDTRGTDASGGGFAGDEREDNESLGERNEVKFSLKGTNDTTSDGARKMNVSERLAKYVEDGVIPTEVYEELVKTYGAIPTGENPHRDVQVPQKTSKDKKVSQTVRTILEAKATPDEALPTIEKMVEDGVFSYDAYTDKQAIADAGSYIKEYGWDESLEDWFDSVEKGEVSKRITTMGWALYNNAANIAATTTSETERTTAIKTSLKILDAMVRHQRSAAQALQATRILKKLSPETQLYGVQKSVEALQKELADRYGDKAPDLKIDEALAEQFINAKTEDERAEIEKEIYKDIGRQMPSRFIDKWNAWRYLAMLGNLRTHIRNIGGNAGFAPVVVAKDLTATAIESVVYRASGKKTVRGKALITGNKADRALLKAAWSDYDNVADLISNGGKYNDSAIANQQIEEGRQIFKTKPLEWARKKNSALLEMEDMWFSKPHYAYALAQYCKANNITAEQIEKGRAIAPARDYAIKESQKATYRDTNTFSQMVSEWGRSGSNDNAVKKTFSAAVEGTLPFRKTPANILVRGVEYSPLGLLKGLSYDLYQVSKGKMSATEVIDNISAGLTGTGLLALGVFLAAQGIIRGHGEDDKEEKEFKELMGHQSYALELPNGQSITLDWLAPEALPFFVGVNIWEATKGSDEEANLSTILQAVSNISEPMLEMSCLQSLNDLFESVGYATSNDTSGLVSVLSSAVTSYITQGLPTLLGQAERTGEENRMTTYTEKNDFLTGDIQYALGRASAKIPLWDYNQIPYIDAWGRKEASGAALKRGLNNFLNPAYTSAIDSSKMENELLSLYKKTGEGGVFPSRADKYFMVDGKRKDLTADEYVRYATLKGEKSYKLVSELVASKAYKKLSDEEKVKALEEVYDYANQKAKQAISNYKPQSWVQKADEFGTNVGHYISFKTCVSGMKEDNGGKISKQEVVDVILDMAQNDSETWKMYLSMYDSDKDMYAYNKGIDGETYMYFLESLDYVDKPTKSGKYGSYTQDEAERAINRLKGLSQQEKAILWQSVNTSWKASNNPFR